MSGTNLGQQEIREACKQFLHACARSLQEYCLFHDSLMAWGFPECHDDFDPDFFVKAASYSVRAPQMPVAIPSDVSTPSPVSRPAVAQPAASLSTFKALVESSRHATDAKTRLDRLYAAIGGCDKCMLCKSRKGVIRGAGAVEGIELFCVTDGTDPEALESGRVFSGEAGDLFEKIMAATKISSDAIYYATIVKCEAEDNRLITSATINACRSHIEQEIDIIKPKVIIAWGDKAYHALYKEDKRNIAQVRGKWQRFNHIPLMPTLHPGYLLKRSDQKRSVWQDLQQVMAELAKNRSTDA